MPGPARIDREDLEAQFPSRHVGAVFCDDDSGQPGPRLAAACSRASRRAEGLLLRAWSSEQIDVLYDEDEAIVAETCRLAMAYGVEGKTEWSGQGAPYQGLEQAALKALKDLADAETRSRGEANGAGTNPRAQGNISAPGGACTQYTFSESRTRPRRGGY
jgi:hypothetical protein